MKYPTTMLVERATAKMEQPVDGLKTWRDAAQEQIAEPVVDACLFSRPTSYAGNAVASHFGFVFGMLIRKSRKIRSGGLPPQFLLAVTKDEVIVLERKMKARGGPLGKPGDEAVRWSRSQLSVTWVPAGYLLKATIVVDGKSHKVSVAKHALSEAFLRLLSDPEDVSAAA
jgi:hypothetical protein